MNIREMILESAKRQDRGDGGLGDQQSASSAPPDRAFRPVDQQDGQAGHNASRGDEFCRVIGSISLSRGSQSKFPAWKRRIER